MVRAAQEQGGKCGQGRGTSAADGEVKSRAPVARHVGADASSAVHDLSSFGDAPYMLSSASVSPSIEWRYLYLSQCSCENSSGNRYSDQYLSDLYQSLLLLLHEDVEYVNWAGYLK